jgi:hypothetical protein
MQKMQREGMAITHKIAILFLGIFSDKIFA